MDIMTSSWDSETMYFSHDVLSDFLSVGTGWCPLMCLPCSAERLPIAVMMVADVLAPHGKVSKITIIYNRVLLGSLHIASNTL